LRQQWEVVCLPPGVVFKACAKSVKMLEVMFAGVRARLEIHRGRMSKRAQEGTNG
jgi:hypothetical protein